MNQLEYDTYLHHKKNYLIWRSGINRKTGHSIMKHTFTYKQQGKQKLRCPHGHLTIYCFETIYVHEVRGTLYLRDVKKIKPNFDTVDIDSPKILNWLYAKDGPFMVL